MAQAAAHVEGQQHPIKLYLVVWGWLFVLSTCSYLVDYFGLHGYFRWSLILIFMVLKAGLIVAIFMHMAWERLALMYAILVPPVLVLVFVGIMVFESNYTLFTRIFFLGLEPSSDWATSRSCFDQVEPDWRYCFVASLRRAVPSMSLFSPEPGRDGTCKGRALQKICERHHAKTQS